MVSMERHYDRAVPSSISISATPLSSSLLQGALLQIRRYNYQRFCQLQDVQKHRGEVEAKVPRGYGEGDYSAGST